MWPRTYLKSLIGTFTSPNYYLTLEEKSWWFSVNFFLISQMIIGLILSLAIIKINFPQYQHQINESIQELGNNYPPDLVINWNRSQLQINQSSPIVVNYPSNFTRTSELPEKAVILLPDQNAEQVPNNLPNSSLMVINQERLFLTDFNGGWSNISLTELPGFDQDFNINQENFSQYQKHFIRISEQILNRAKKALPMILPLVVASTQFFDSLLYAVIGFFGLKIVLKKVSFTKIWQISLHLSVVAFSISQLVAFIYPDNDLAMYPLTFWILFAVVVGNMAGKIQKV